MSANKLCRLLPLIRLNRNACQRLPKRDYNWPQRRDPLRDVFTEMDRTFNRMARDWDHFWPSRMLPMNWGFRSVPIETTESGQRLFKIELDLNGFRPEDISVTVKDREVTVRAKTESETNGSKQLREYSYQYSLPKEVDIEQVKSLFNTNGLLTIEAPLPHIKEPEVKEIPINRQSSNAKVDDK